MDTSYFILPLIFTNEIWAPPSQHWFDFIDTITVFNSSTLYDNKRITVKEEFVPILRKLNIILDDRRTRVTKQESHNAMDYTDRYYCVCNIDKEKLKRFCKEWNYQYE